MQWWSRKEREGRRERKIQKSLLAGQMMSPETLAVWGSPALSSLGSQGSMQHNYNTHNHAFWAAIRFYKLDNICEHAKTTTMWFTFWWVANYVSNTTNSTLISMFST